MTMVEKVARAISAKLEEYGFEAYEVAEAEGRTGWSHEIARAAIEAMRTPTAAMERAVSANWGRRTWEQYGEVIDAALNEGSAI